MMESKRITWDTVDKSKIRLENLMEEYLLVCQTENKSVKTIRGYREKLERFCKWIDGDLGCFTLRSVREYIGMLQSIKKYESHPYHPTQTSGLSSLTIKGHVVVVKGFATWLWEEEYTTDHVLSRLKLPKAIRKVMETLTKQEIQRLLACIPKNSWIGYRNAAMVLLLLDTGLRCQELVSLLTRDLFLNQQYLKALGKGQKERIVPFGASTARALYRYLNLRPQTERCDKVFLGKDGGPLTENGLRLVFQRLAKKAEIPRLHIHLLRHTMATNYLIAGGHPIQLQRILGHETFEMTRRYIDMVAVQTAVMESRQSPVDSLGLK